MLRLVSIAGCFLVGIWLPVRMIGYVPSMSLEVCFDLLISIVSAANIYLNLQEQKKLPEHEKPPFSTRLGLFLDVICLLPLSFFAFYFFSSSVESILFLNLLCVRHVRKIKPFLDQFASLQPITYRLVPVALFMPLIVHLIACGWIALGSGSAGANPDKYLEYVKAIYWAFTTLTTVGYGDITAQTPGQMLFACGVQVLGVGVFGFILSNVASLLSRSDAAREHHMDNLDKIETFMRSHYIPGDLRSEVRSYYHYLWTNKKGYLDDSLLEGLPAKIQSDLWFHINQSIITKVPFLRGASQELLEDLMNQLKPRVFIPGERIFRVDEPGDALYFVHSGQVQVLSRENAPIANLGEGAFFGEMALISDKPRSATVRALTYCDLYVLERESFERVTKAYPHFRDHLLEVVSKRTAA